MRLFFGRVSAVVDTLFFADLSDFLLLQTIIVYLCAFFWAKIVVRRRQADATPH